MIAFFGSTCSSFRLMLRPNMSESVLQLLDLEKAFVRQSVGLKFVL